MRDEENMKEAEKIMKQFQQQYNSSNNINVPHNIGNNNGFDNQSGVFSKLGDGNNIGMGFDNQGDGLNLDVPLNQTPTINTGLSKPTAVDPSLHRSDICPQCGSIHPPLKPGEKCPNASVAKVVSKSGLDDITINKHLADFRNIIVSNISSKNIRNGEKFFQHIIVELTKIIEQYSE